MTGKVYLVGAGPGDPGLITVKGLACIARADVIVYDYLASTALLRHAAPHAEQIYVGKKGGDHTLSQDEINALLVRKAKANRVVTRLKGGDPFIFGRGGEEAEILQAAGIRFEIVPGVTSAIAAPAYAGIPLTHRKYTATVALVTGHEDPTKAQSNIDWPALARMGTLVLLMGVKNLPLIVEQLRAAGMPPTRPVALIRWGTTAKQQTVTGTLETIVDRVHKAQLRAPAIIVIGDVVQLQPAMQWFENRPLWGKTILVTRAREQASDLVNRLTELGANCIESPTIQVVPPDDLLPLDQALDQLARYDWLVFTSVNGVGFFFKRLFERGQDVRALGHLRTATIGPATAARLREYGLTSDIIPASYRAEAVVAAFEQEQIDGRRVLLPRAAEARPVLPQELTRMGAEVDEITVYHTQPVVAHTETLLQLLETRQIDLITFTSSSTVTNFIGLLPAKCRDQLLQGVAVACIGPITADTAKNFQLPVDIMAQEYTIPGLCDAILGHYHPESTNTA